MENHIDILLPYSVNSKDNQPIYFLQITKWLELDPKDVILRGGVNPRFLYIAGGEGYIYFSDRKITVREGDLVLLRSMESTKPVSFSNNNPIYLIALHFFPVAIMSIASDMVDFRLINVLYSNDTSFDNMQDKNNPYVQEIIRTILEIKDELTSKKPNFYAAKAKCVNILARLPDVVDVDAFSGKESSSKHMQMIADTIAYINNHLTEDITLEMLAHQANMEISHFSSIFKAAHGISPWKYVLHARIELAMVYLREKQYSITKVADMTGFRNLSNFNKIFKNITGMTPSQYRKNQKNIHL